MDDPSNIDYGSYIRELTSSNKPIGGSLEEFLEKDLELLETTPHSEELQMKMVLIGEPMVGKTAIRQRYLGEGFKSLYMMTIGADLSAPPSFQLGDKTLRFQIWDLAGQPTFSTVRESYYRGAAGALLVFDVTNRTSYDYIPDWINELWRWNGKGPIPVVFLGNKVDLLEEAGSDIVEDSEAENFVLKINRETRSRHGFGVSYLPTSAKANLNIEEAFAQVAISIIVFNTIIESSGLKPLHTHSSMKWTRTGPGF